MATPEITRLELTPEQQEQQQRSEMAKRAETAKTMALTDPIELDLFVRYNMDPKIWRLTSREGLLFTTPLSLIIGLPLALPLIFLTLALAAGGKTYLLTTVLSTIMLSLLGYYISETLIVTFKDTLIKRGIQGRDLNKAGQKREKPPVAEALGIVVSIVFMLITVPQQVTLEFTMDRLVEHNAGLLAIAMVVLLGFVDDVVDLKWRYKLVFPTIASFPLLVAYKGPTSVVVPKLLRVVFGNYLNLGALYYIYMSNISIFCTNAINIYAGINGIEVGQSFIIGCFVLIHNVIEIVLNKDKEGSEAQETLLNHMYSLTIMLPFVACTLALVKYNSFPSQVFVGDTFCYAAGMTFAVVGILGHFSKTLMLFFIP